LATKNDQVRRIWIENVPNGEYALDIVLKTENMIRAVDLNEIAQEASQTVIETGKKLEAFKTKSSENINEALQSAQDLKSSVEKRYQESIHLILETKENFEKKVKNVTDSVKGTVDKGTSVVTETTKKVQDGYHQAGDAVRSIVLGQTKNLDNTKHEISDVVTKKLESNGPEHGNFETKPADVHANDAELKTSQLLTPEVGFELSKEDFETSSIPQESSAEKHSHSEIETRVIVPSDSERSTDSAPELAFQSQYVDEVALPQQRNLSLGKPIIPVLMAEMNDLSTKLMSFSQQQGVQLQKELISIAQHLSGLTEFLEFLQAEEISLLAVSLNEQAEKFQKELKDLKSNTDQQISDTQARITNSFGLQIAEERMKLQKEHQQELVSRLQEQSELFQKALEGALKEQSEQLEAFWGSEVKKRLDSERKGRLARLDHLALKLKYLERMSLNGSDYVRRSTQIHSLQAVIKSLKLKLCQSKTPNIKSELTALLSLGKEDPLVVTVLNSFGPNDLTDFMSLDELHFQFEKMKPVLFRNQLLPNEAGPLSYITSRMLSYFMLPKKGLVPGNDTLSILSRAEYHLEHEDLSQAVLEMNKLKGWTRLLADDWLKYSRIHLTVLQAMQVIETRLNLQSLGYIQ
jgi:MICOS complex subunit MIC60